MFKDTALESPTIRAFSREILSDYLSLCKPRIVLMITLTAALGFYVGNKGELFEVLFLWSLLGTALSCAGAGALNNYIERDVDRLMKRTVKRAIPAGRISPNSALLLGIILVLLGTTLLVIHVNLLTGFVALLTSFLYVLVYTPLKRVTWLNTAIGAIPGALPPLGGWAAATGTLDLGAWVLFLILFLWQHPHFYAIAWMYKDDYARGGFKMLPVVEPDGESTFRQIVVYSALLTLASLLPALMGIVGMVYIAGAILLGIFITSIGGILYRSHSAMDAKRMLHASILYLPILMALIVSDSTF